MSTIASAEILYIDEDSISFKINLLSSEEDGTYIMQKTRRRYFNKFNFPYSDFVPLKFIKVYITQSNYI